MSVDNPASSPGYAMGQHKDERPAAEQLKEQAREMGREQQRKVAQLADEQKRKVSRHFDSVAEAINASGEQLRDQGEPGAEYVTMAADKVREVASFLRETEPGEMVREVRGFARRQPALFLAGAFMLGFAASRFFKSSGREPGGQHRHRRPEYDYGRAPTRHDPYTPYADETRYPLSTSANRSGAMIEPMDVREPVPAEKPVETLSEHDARTSPTTAK